MGDDEGKNALAAFVNLEVKAAEAEGAKLIEMKLQDETVAKLYKNGLDNFSSTTK